jgi:hypothetical protein
MNGEGFPVPVAQGISVLRPLRLRDRAEPRVGKRHWALAAPMQCHPASFLARLSSAVRRSDLAARIWSRLRCASASPNTDYERPGSNLIPDIAMRAGSRRVGRDSVVGYGAGGHANQTQVTPQAAAQSRHQGTAVPTSIPKLLQSSLRPAGRRKPC